MMNGNDPLVTVILTAQRGGEELARCLVSLGDQSLAAWRCILVDRGDGAAGAQGAAWAAGDERFEFTRMERAGLSAGRNAALGGARGRYVHLLDEDHSLAPGGLAALLATAQSSRWGAAIGGVERIGTRGEALAAPPGAGAGAIGLQELRSGIGPFAPAMLVRRATLGELRFDPSHGEAAERDLWLRLAEGGVKWERCPSVVVRQRIEPLSSMVEAKSALSKHLGVIADSRARRGAGGSPDSDGGLAPLLMALLSLRLATDGGGDPDAMAKNLCAMGPGAEPGDIAAAALGALAEGDGARAAAREPVLEQVGAGPALWWRRWGFCGEPPRAIGGVARDRLAAIIGSVERVPARVLEACEPGRQIVLLGLGKNARKIARLLARRGDAVVGRDDGLVGPPAWAAEEGIDVRVLGPNERHSPEAQHVMTVLDDGVYMQRLPPGLRVVRWSAALRMIEEERGRWLARWRAE